MQSSPQEPPQAPTCPLCRRLKTRHSVNPKTGRIQWQCFRCPGKPAPPVSQAEANRRWREANPEKSRAITREATRRYRERLKKSGAKAQ